MKISAVRKLCVIFLCGLFVLPAARQAEAADTIETIGDVIAYGMPVVVMGASWRKGDTDGMWQLGKTWVSSVALSYGLKFLVNSERPNGDNYAFPSAHTVSAFSTASYVHYRYGIKRAWPAYMAAGFTAWSRIHSDEHNWEDVIGGAVIGHVMARIFTDRYENIPPLAVTFNSKQNVYAIRTQLKF